MHLFIENEYWTVGVFIGEEENILRIKELLEKTNEVLIPIKKDVFDSKYSDQDFAVLYHKWQDIINAINFELLAEQHMCVYLAYKNGLNLYMEGLA